MFYLSLPFLLLKFWFLEAPLSLIVYFESFNKAFLDFFSLFLLVKTFFKPWKNEYREGLVGFSIGMGIFVKTWVILFTILFFLILLILELLILIGFVSLPIWTIVVLLK